MKTYKFKLKPTRKQEQTFESWLSTCRALFNLSLQQKITAYEMRRITVSKFDQYNQLPELKKDFPWFGEVYSDTLQDVLDRLDFSFKKFFTGSGFPKFSKKGTYNSFTFKRSFVVKENTIKLPKIGEVKYFNSRPIVGTPKTATIIKEVDGWFICITSKYNTEFDQIVIDNQNAIGIDMGVVKTFTLSDGSTIIKPKTDLSKIKKLQRKLSRQKKGSKEREKTKIQIQKAWKKVSNQRLDFLHKTTTNLVKSYSAIYIEDLKLQKMQGGGLTNVNRDMSDNNFSKFKELLKYKTIEKGKHLGLVNPAYTSQTCSACGSVDKKSRLSQADFVCTSCGTILNADVNASQNILSKGITQSTQRKTIV